MDGKEPAMGRGCWRFCRDIRMKDLKSANAGVSYRYWGRTKSGKGDMSVDFADSMAGSGSCVTMLRGDNSVNRERDSREALTARFGVTGVEWLSSSCIRCMTAFNSAS